MAPERGKQLPVLEQERVGNPAKGDGRNIDPGLGVLSGEGAGQRTRSLEGASRTSTVVVHAPASQFSASGPGDSPTYYDLPSLKAPVWTASIPLYFYVGGAAGATSVLGAALTLAGRDRFPRLTQQAGRIGLLGDSLSAALLIEDLGRPSRFLNMLRVFRPTSPMSVGSFVLAGSGAFNGLGFLLARRRGLLGKIGRAADVGAGVLGLPLAGYTAVLLANTAVPTWQGAHRTLPFLFVSSSIASSGSLLELTDGLSPREQRVVRTYARIGKLAVLAAGVAVDAELARAPKQAAPLREGLAGTLWTASKVLTGASAVLSLLPGRARWKRDTAGALGTLGALAMRFAIFQAGRVSSRNPRATFEPQRQGLGAHQVTGVAAITGPGGARALPDRFALPVIR